MLTEQDIEKFYCDLESMKLRKPNAVMKKASGLSSGNVSEYLNRKKPPSESFITAFYEKVYKPSTNALLSEDKEVKQNNHDKDKIIADQAATIKRLLDNESRLIKMLEDANSLTQRKGYVSSILEEYLQQLADGLAYKKLSDANAVREEFDTILGGSLRAGDK